MRHTMTSGSVLRLAVLLLALAAPVRLAGADDRPLTVFAAASTAPAMEELARIWEDQGNGPVRCVFASSGVLARQIANGAPADLFLSANTEWMSWLAGQEMVADASVPLLGNRLVLIQPAAASTSLALDSSLAAQLADQHLAIGDPDHVPAGAYARSALESLGLWDDVEPRLVRMADVRAAVLLVERGEAVAGIVYASDAVDNPRIRVAAEFPATSHKPIVYPAAIVAGGQVEAARRLLAWLREPTALTVFRRHGFTGQ